MPRSTIDLALLPRTAPRGSWGVIPPTSGQTPDGEWLDLFDDHPSDAGPSVSLAEASPYIDWFAEGETRADAAEQAWLDATPPGEARLVGGRPIVDRRHELAGATESGPAETDDAEQPSEPTDRDGGSDPGPRFSVEPIREPARVRLGRVAGAVALGLLIGLALAAARHGDNGAASLLLLGAAAWIDG